ncbi:MAG: hypothetical protein DSY90_04465 [Deltaproteobacteria bacterium]|nr:MAG: hypothetical protein DSY90_04465 [Deltaproteobacteria bacterium]
MDPTNNPDWIYVVVQAPGENESFLGQHDDENDISFIPVFDKKEDAQNCLPLMARERSVTYEIQAVYREELLKNAGENGFYVYFLDGSGTILEKINIAEDGADD